MSAPGRIWSKLATFGTGLLFMKSTDYLFDYLLYPQALIILGYLWGWIVMTIASVFLNLLVIRVYDWAKRDFLLLESLKQLRTANSTHQGKRVLAKVLSRGDVAAFFVLSWFEDPVIVTLYLRKGSGKFDGLSRRDWAIFWASTLVSNLMWAGSLISLIEIYRLLR